jgi:S-adenosylmethionine hydrolase
VTYDWISLTTDYGLADGFVGACHGVIAGLAPTARVIDVTHGVPPQRIRHGATALADTVPYLPECVHVAVVDPGVGTSRRGVVVVTGRGLLVGPDNGLLLPAALALGGVQAAYELTAPEYRLATVSATFHGRDVFAPAAAHLALGVPPDAFGPPVTDLVELPKPLVRAVSGRLDSEVLVIDHFGNIQLAATAEDLLATGITGTGTVSNGQTTVDAVLGRTFADAPPGTAVLYPDSSGHLAVAVNQASAAALLHHPTHCTITP